MVRKGATSPPLVVVRLAAGGRRTRRCKASSKFKHWGSFVPAPPDLGSRPGGEGGERRASPLLEKEQRRVGQHALEAAQAFTRVLCFSVLHAGGCARMGGIASQLATKPCTSAHPGGVRSRSELSRGAKRPRRQRRLLARLARLAGARVQGQNDPVPEIGKGSLQLDLDCSGTEGAASRPLTVRATHVGPSWSQRG